MTKSTHHAPEMDMDIPNNGNDQNQVLEDEFTIYTEGDELYDDMLSHISSAQRTIEMESYIFNPDVVGLRFIDALMERARSGLAVRLHLDAFGSKDLYFSDYGEQLIAAGVQLKWYNTLNWRDPVRFNKRNHRKLLIIDEEHVWLGGFNIHIENSLREYGVDRWRDTQVRIKGPLASQARVYFDRLWQGNRRWRPGFDISTGSTLVSNHNWYQRHLLRRELARRFKKARKRIWICTPYFMPDQFTQRHMARAARRGVDVRLLLPFKTDRPVTQWLARAVYASLMASGMRIYEYTPRILHAKTMVIDEDWCTVGSANLDYRSLFVNYELNLISCRHELLDRLRQDYEDDLAVSREIKPQMIHEYRLTRWFYHLLGNLLRRIL